MSLLWKSTITFPFANMYTYKIHEKVLSIPGKVSLLKAVEKFERKGFSLFIIMQVCDFVQKDDDFNIF